MKSLILFSFVTFSTLGLAENFTAKSCEDSDFLRGAWQDVAKQEPIISETLKKMGAETGEYGPIINVTNCWIKIPLDEKDVPIDGTRMAVIDKVWVKDNRTHQMGMKIIYRLTTNRIEYVDGSSGYEKQRVVKGLVICHGPATCEMLDIPFKKSEKPPATKSETKLPIKPEGKPEQKTSEFKPGPVSNN